MKFALVDNSRAEATKGANGKCPSCGSQLIAKCGELKTHHWAHKGNRNCDPWWENETEWHRSWKNNFHPDWQEVSLYDQQTNQNHIADIRTTHELVIEFQHSYLDVEERRSREMFYKRMIWVVDGARLKRDYARFCNGTKNLQATNRKGYFFVEFPDECFPSAWLESSVPVIFDFRGTESINDPADRRHHLYCLFPRISDRNPILAIIDRQFFISSVINGEWFKDNAAPQRQPAIPPTENSIIIRRRDSPYVYVRGRWRRRRRL